VGFSLEYSAESEKPADNLRFGRIKTRMQPCLSLQILAQRARSTLLVAGIGVFFVTTAAAQSGRRSTNPGAATPSVSGAKTAEKQSGAKHQLMLLVGIEDHNAPWTPSYLTDTVLDDCIRRLGDAVDVIPKSLGRGITRAQAIERAKNEREIYVVWLQLGSDLEDSGKQSKKGPDELYIRYTIFEPDTGKVKQSGRTHKEIYRASRGGVSASKSSRDNPIYSDFAVKQAAREAAERVLEGFDITLRGQS